MKLYQHQIDALERTKDFNCVAYYHDMGMGKTFTGAEKLMSFQSKVNLVICQKSKINDWTNHFKKHYNVKVLDLTKNHELKEFIWLSGSYINSSRIVGIINYDLVFRREEILNLREFSLMLDESSLIQNDKAKRTKAILKLKAKNVILLSGTPVGGKYENLYSQLKLLGWNLTKKSYWDQFVDYKLIQYGCGPLIPKINGYKNVDLLKTMLRNYGADFLKSDEVLDLPEQNFNIVNVARNKEYKQFQKHKVITIDDTELVGDNPLKALLYSRMLCGMYNKFKLNAFIDLLDSTDDRIVVFYNFTQELEVLKNAIGKRAYSVVNGTEKDLRDYENVDNSITFVQYAAGAMGINLQKANKMIYFSLPLSSELFEQSKKRIHRIGQSSPCFYYMLMCENTVEEKILATLELRQDYTQKLFEKDFEVAK